MKHKNIKRLALLPGLALLTACGNAVSYDNFQIPQQGESMLKPISNYYIDDPIPYDQDAPREETQAVFSSDNGICVIEKKKSYYDITLDLEKGSHYEAGRAYAEAMFKAYPEYTKNMEAYLYENVKGEFNNLDGDYQTIEDRTMAMYNAIEKDYRDEIDGFNDVIVGEKAESEGFVEDGIISREEAILSQFIPDVIRGTACSSLSVWGDKVRDGGHITLRSLEWPFGSEMQMCSIHCVLRLKNGSKSVTAMGFLGNLNTMTGVNDDGVFAAIHDVGNGGEYEYENKTSYTFELRHALENFDTAKDAAKYINEKSLSFTYCHNVLIADKNNTFCAENCTSNTVETGYANSIIRDADTPLLKDLKWDCKNSLCVVNSFASKGNYDLMSGDTGNLVRWEKYRQIVNETEKFTTAEMKGIMSKEDVEQSAVVTVHSPISIQLFVYDHESGSLQASFTQPDGVKDHPDFVEIS